MTWKRALTDAQRLEVVERYRAGESIAALAFAYGCSNTPIREALRRNGAAPTRKRALTDAQRREVAERYRAGETLAQLAHAFGCSVMPIQSALRKHGVRARRFVNFAGRHGGRYVDDAEYLGKKKPRWWDHEELLR